MTEQQINISIAEADGWKRDKKRAGCWLPPGAKEGPYVFSDESPTSYTTDLNAMHEAVIAQPQDWQDRFTIELTRLCGSHKLAVNASASKRAEAYLRTIGKWKD